MSSDGPSWWRPAFDSMPLDEFIHDQHDVVSRKQWLLAGSPLAALRRRLRRRDWTTVFPGVYFTHRARPRRVRRQPGLAVHSSKVEASRLALGLSPPRVTAAHATPDRIDECASLDDAYALTADSCQTGQVLATDVSTALGVRRVRWGRELRRALGSALDGSDSPSKCGTSATWSVGTNYHGRLDNVVWTTTSPTVPTSGTAYWSSWTVGFTCSPSGDGGTCPRTIEPRYVARRRFVTGGSTSTPAHAWSRFRYSTC